MDFYELEDFTYSDLEFLIKNEVEENVHLDYKSAGSLAKEDKKRNEITKDVSAFANSDGGIIIYGIHEEEHKPHSFSHIDGTVYTKEWLENIINLIQPRIENVKIFPIRRNGELHESVYVVKIPRSIQAPHMARDKRYYKRFNFVSEPMEDYEVKDVMFRHHSPQLRSYGATLEKDIEHERNDNVVYVFKAWIRNVGTIISKDYKLSAAFFNLPQSVTCNYQPAEGAVLSTYMCDYCFRLTSPSKEPIFPDEMIETGHYRLIFPKDFDINKVYVKLTLRYEDGGKDEVLTSLVANSEPYIRGANEIEKYIKKEHPDFNFMSIL